MATVTPTSPTTTTPSNPDAPYPPSPYDAAPQTDASAGQPTPSNVWDPADETTWPWVEMKVLLADGTTEVDYIPAPDSTAPASSEWWAGENPLNPHGQPSLSYPQQATPLTSMPEVAPGEPEPAPEEPERTPRDIARDFPDSREARDETQSTLVRDRDPSIIPNYDPRFEPRREEYEGSKLSEIAAYAPTERPSAPAEPAQPADEEVI